MSPHASKKAQHLVEQIIALTCLAIVGGLTVGGVRLGESVLVSLLVGVGAAVFLLIVLFCGYVSSAILVGVMHSRRSVVDAKRLATQAREAASNLPSKNRNQASSAGARERKAVISSLN